MVMWSTLARWLSCLAVILLAPVAGAWAEEPDATASFAAMLRSTQHRNTVLETARQGTIWVNDPCPSATFTPLDQYAVYQPVRVGRGGKPTAGAWRESVKVEGCGVSRILNVFTAVHSAGDLVSVAGLPGTTRADPLLQRDSMPIVTPAVKGRPAGCQQLYVADTRFIATEGEAGPVGSARRVPWREEWTFVTCDKRSVVTVHFTPTPDGGTDIRVVVGETR
jgi:hypothetical protein